MKNKLSLFIAILVSFGFSVFIWHAAAFAQNTPETAGTVAKEKEVTVRFSFGNNNAVVIMENNAASLDFLSLLPLTLDFEDYNGTEKISYLPRKLNIHDAPLRCKPSAGTVAYYEPWGNLAVFYHDFRESNGLVPLGQIVSGLEKLSSMRGDFSMRIEKVE